MRGAQGRRAAGRCGGALGLILRGIARCRCAARITASDARAVQEKCVFESAQKDKRDPAYCAHLEDEQKAGEKDTFRHVGLLG